ncbi:MAG: ATP-dependent helicase [bacterium]|nr:ATP-dependent helicase [bacterium]
MSFAGRYKKLNQSQAEAVDTIDGPVMVVAGPGTGKTELLSMRVANILKQTDTLPESILCLTFTDSGAEAMRERLFDIIGQDAYKVAVHTFHSFGSEIINRNPTYFYNGANFRAADDISNYELLSSIFEDLPDTDILATKMNGDYTYLKSAKFAISELKRSGLTNSELRNIIKANEHDLDLIEPTLQAIFAARIGKSTAGELSGCLDDLDFAESPQADVPPLGMVVRDSLNRALSEAAADNSTKPITAWKNSWLTKNDQGNLIFKDRSRHARLCSIGSIYDTYLHRMQENELFDFDDMILRVVHAMEVFPDLRFNLQEQFQYVMVDEFQDTNLAQARIMSNLLDNPVHEGRPNIMVVGDDDQAIYSFQGADVSNIIEFRKKYTDIKIIALTQNYRSTSQILELSRQVITQGTDRLEDTIDDLSKLLSANYSADSSAASIEQFGTIEQERSWIASDIKAKLDSGVPAQEITVLARQHSELEQVLPYLVDQGIPLSYEKQANILDLDIIKLIVKLSRLILSISDSEHDIANSLLPDVLAHPAFEIDPLDTWKLSLEAYQKRVSWLEAMLAHPSFVAIAKWLINLSQAVPEDHLEVALDKITGSPHSEQLPDSADVEAGSQDPVNDSTEEFMSPIYNYYFSESARQSSPGDYLSFLNALITLRSKLRDYRPGQTSYLGDLLEFIDIHARIGSNIMSRQQTASKDSSAINLMSVHKSKGLEFEYVYIHGAIDSMWGEKVRRRTGANIDYPENLQIGRSGDSLDERLRLFYVAMTRAKNHLFMSYSQLNDKNKSTPSASFLAGSAATVNDDHGSQTTAQIEKSAELAWYQPIIDVPQSDMQKLLGPVMDKYKLSPTHMNNFIDISRGGPQAFLVQNLLRFPQSISAPAIYGSAIHETLQLAHNHVLATGEQKPVEDSIQTFEKLLEASPLSDGDIQKLSSQGANSLRIFLATDYGKFNSNQKSELNFSYEDSLVGEAKITGKLDLVEFDKTDKTVTVVDYKTGKASKRWLGTGDYEKIKLHKYQQQLMFYKLLIERSRNYHSFSMTRGMLQFVEPTDQNEIISLDLEFSTEELDRFETLIQKVWHKIMTFDFPDTSIYPSTLKGLLQFEDDLIDGSI